MPLRWIAILRDQTQASLAATGGIHSAEDVLKMLLVGADVTMMASALIQRGPEYLTRVLTELTQRMEQKGFESVERIKGLVSQRRCPDPTAFERANYIRTISSFTRQVNQEDLLAPVGFGVQEHAPPSIDPDDSASRSKPKVPR
jgi:dihydroorotate dehydrogenase (fumarate)